MAEVYFPGFKYFGNWSRRFHSKFSKVLHQITINQTFEESISRRALSAVLGNKLNRKTLSKVISQISQVSVLVNIQCIFLLHIGKNPVTKFGNMKVHMNLNDLSLLDFCKSIRKNYPTGINFHKWALKGKFLSYWFSPSRSKITKFGKISITNIYF